MAPHAMLRRCTATEVLPSTVMIRPTGMIPSVTGIIMITEGMVTVIHFPIPGAIHMVTDAITTITMMTGANRIGNLPLRDHPANPKKVTKLWPAVREAKPGLKDTIQWVGTIPKATM